MDDQLIKYFDGKMNEDERLDFLHKVETDESLKKSFIEYRNLLGLFSLIDHSGDEEEGLEDYRLFTGKNVDKQRKIRLLRIVKYAAMAIFLIVSSWMASYFFNTQFQEIKIEYNTLHVPAGQRASVTLSDGTQVWLNAKSTLSYPAYFGKDERLVKITGEAFFNVAKNRDKPFIVSTSKLDIKVLGTIFNVKDYAETDSINISLLEGAVEVYNQTNTSKAIMKPNECLNYKDGIMTITQEINENEFLWKEGIYTFERERLENIVKKLELYYDTKIIIKNPYIAKYEYTGKFRQRDGVMEILKVIQQIHKFKVAKDEASNIIVLE